MVDTGVAETVRKVKITYVSYFWAYTVTQY